MALTGCGSDQAKQDNPAPSGSSNSIASPNTATTPNNTTDTSSSTGNPNNSTNLTDNSNATTENSQTALSCQSDNADYNAALQSGDASQVTSQGELISESLILLECLSSKFDVARAKLFGLNPDGSANTTSLSSISWDNTHDAASLLPTPGETQSLLVSNDTWRDDGRIDNAILAVIGQQGNSRQIIMGGNPLRNFQRNSDGLSEDMHQFMRNSLEWLTDRDDLANGNLNIVTAHLDQSYYFPDYDATVDWLTTEYGDELAVNAREACDAAALAECLETMPDLLIISDLITDTLSIDSVISAVQAAIDRGTPVLYMHLDGHEKELSARLLPLFNVQFNGDNYWARQRVTAFDPTAVTEDTTTITKLQMLLKAFRDNSFSVDFTQCSDHTCDDNSGYQDQFLNPVSALQTRLNKMDSTGQRLFDLRGRHMDKALVLLADKFRREIRMPMDKLTSPTSAFLQSMFADRVNPVLRNINPAQFDMGNHSRSDFSHITPVTKSITIKARDQYKAAGVYAIPGQTVIVTRTDNADLNTTIKVNLIRSGSTHEFNENTYNRPKFVSTQDLPIAAGQTITFTTAYGGPIQIGFDGKDVNTSFTFENVGEHAIWRNNEDDTDFTYKLAANEFDWAELITPSFQVHSKLDKMQETVSGEFWGNAAAVGTGTETYMHNYAHALAGFKGTGIDVVDEVHDFAIANGLEIHTLDKVKHMNADQALCGYGCSGNPYDAYWSFNPVGHGDLHELGHGLERNRFRFSGQPNHAVTNPYSYYSKWKFAEATDRTADEVDCQSLPYERLFDQLQASRAAIDPATYMRDQNLTSWQDGAAINQQMMMAVQNQGILDDGRMLLARLHVIDREFEAANDETSWLDKKDGLGFGNFTLDQATALTNNDWNLIALTHASKRNMTDYLEMWGFEFTDAAKTQAAFFNYIPMPLIFYTVPDNAHCDSFDDLPAQTIDGTTSWP